MRRSRPHAARRRRRREPAVRRRRTCVGLHVTSPRGRPRVPGRGAAVGSVALSGGGPADVVELTLALAREMLAGAGRDDVDPADKLADGSAMDTWRAMVSAQGGDPAATLPTARETHVVTALRLPMLGVADSLNVSITAAVLLYEARRQRGDK